jgi:hypothetical protein
MAVFSSRFGFTWALAGLNGILVFLAMLLGEIYQTHRDQTICGEREVRIVVPHLPIAFNHALAMQQNLDQILQDFPGVESVHVADYTQVLLSTGASEHQQLPTPTSYLTRLPWLLDVQMNPLIESNLEDLEDALRHYHAGIRVEHALQLSEQNQNHYRRWMLSLVLAGSLLLLLYQQLYRFALLTFSASVAEQNRAASISWMSLQMGGFVAAMISVMGSVFASRGLSDMIVWNLYRWGIGMELIVLVLARWTHWTHRIIMLRAEAR